MPRCSPFKGPVPRSLGEGGFTLVELLISISIIGIITGFMMANFRGGQQSAEVRLAAELLVSQIRSMQTSALSGRLASVCSGGSEDLDVCESGKTPAVACTGGLCQKRVPTGYGLRFTSTDPTGYTLFYDTDGDHRYDLGEEAGDAPYVSTGTVKLDASDAGVPFDLVYAPPFGQTYVNGLATGPAKITLTLGHQFGTTTRHVSIFLLSGKIEHD